MLVRLNIFNRPNFASPTDNQTPLRSKRSADSRGGSNHCDVHYRQRNLVCVESGRAAKYVTVRLT